MISTTVFSPLNATINRTFDLAAYQQAAILRETCQAERQAFAFLAVATLFVYIMNIMAQRKSSPAWRFISGVTDLSSTMLVVITLSAFFLLEMGWLH